MPGDREKISSIEGLVKTWINQQGHDKCWYYPDVFRQIAKVLEIEYTEPKMVSEGEFNEGCKRYQHEIYHTPTIEGRIPL